MNLGMDREKVAGAFTYELTSSFGRRLSASILDFLILFVPCAVLGLVIPVVGWGLAYFLYAPFLESSPLQATIGKHLMGIQASDVTGQRLTLKMAFIRNCVKLVSSFFFFIGHLFALFTDKRQALHDLVADSIVVYGRSDLPVFESWILAIRDFCKTFTDKYSSVSQLDQLERLQVLRDKGALTEEEFQMQKQKILNNEQRV